MGAPSPGSFAVSPPLTHAWMLLVALGGILPLAGIGALMLAGKPMAELVPVLLVLPLVLAVLLLSMRRRSVELRDGVLDVRGAMFRKRIAASELDLQRARIVDLQEHTELRPFIKTNGMSLPGFHVGHFRLRENLGKAFCLLTDRRRVLWLPARDGKSQLLLSLEQPQALLDALRQAP